MERISLVKNSQVRTLVLSGAENMGYSLAIRTNCVDTPIFLYVNRDLKSILVYNCGLKRDELIIMDYKIPAKLKVISDEYNGFSDTCHREVGAILEKIHTGTFFQDKTVITYL
ncbi:MAG: hypothetical protein KKD44_10085 [Proteobacteria bacterium]|nr:hypothetical protein [Pseudomonadota bacterium]